MLLLLLLLLLLLPRCWPGQHYIQQRGEQGPIANPAEDVPTALQNPSRVRVGNRCQILRLLLFDPLFCDFYC